MVIQNLCGGNNEILYTSLKPCVDGILRDDITILFYNAIGEYDLSLEYIRQVVKENTDLNLKNYAQNRHVIILCNRAWHKVSFVGCDEMLTPYLRGLGLDTRAMRWSSSISMKKEYKLLGERFIQYKNGPVLASMVPDSKTGYTVVYLSSYFEPNNQNSGKYIKDVFTQFSLSNHNPNIFSQNVRKKATEGRKSGNFSFTSINSQCEKVLEKEYIGDIVEEMLEKVDYKNLVPLFNAYVKGKDKIIPTMDKNQLRVWLKNWANAKWRLYLLFGRSFYIKASKEIKKDSKLESVQINELKYAFPEYSLILGEFPVECYLNNIIPKGFACSLFEYKPCPPNIKLSKYLAGLLQNPKFDVQLSSIIQDNLIKANVTLSIDPFDYMTSAINKSGWRSCHNVYDGEYRRGPISYMMDNSSIVSYIASDKIYDYCLGGFKFKGNSKICRQMIHISTDSNVMIFNRLYPQHYSNDEIYVFIRSILEETVSKFCGIENFWKTKKSGAKYEGCYSNDSKFHYDDIQGNETMLVKHKGLKKSYHVNIGAKILCPICNKNPITGHTVCSECRNKISNGEPREDREDEVVEPDFDF